MNQIHQGRQALFGLIVGAVALVVLTALLTSAVASSNTEHKLSGAVTRLQDIADRQAEIQAEQEASRRADAQRMRGTLAARKRLYHQNAELQRQLRALANFLRAHGFDVPRSLTTPHPEPSTRPKAPRRRHPATPAPTAPSPSSTPSPTYCQLVPALCTGLPITLPTLQPKEHP